MSRRTVLGRATVKRRKKIVTYIEVQREVVSAGPVYTAFAEVLRMRRGDAGARQEDVAREVGMSRPSLANIEAGRQRVYLDDVFTFAKALKIDPQKLFAMVVAEINSM